MFLLFAYDTYYPKGGWNDFHAAFNTEKEARQAALNLRYIDNWHIVDSQNKVVIAKYEGFWGYPE